MEAIESLGERIRNLRKQKQLTLEALAGDQLTKGMLSLIENGKANPSMESLNYIAKQLDVSTTELLAEVSSLELRELLEKVEELFKIGFEDLTDEYRQIIDFIRPYHDKLPVSYEGARLLEIYSRCLFHEKTGDWTIPYHESLERYEKLNLVNHRFKMIILFAMTKFIEHKYGEALKIIQDERRRVESQNSVLEDIVRLDFDYYESILCFAIGDSEKAKTVMNSAIKFSREKKLFYLTDGLYRVAAFEALMRRDEEQYQHFLTKLEQYAAFADDQMAFAFLDLFRAHYYNSYVHDYEKAQIHTDKYVYKSDKDYSYFYPEKGKSLYGLGKYEEALEWLEKHVLSPHIHHPFDLSMLYEVDSYKALCYLKLGRTDQALTHARMAAVNVEPMPWTPYKDFINETLRTIEEASI